MTTINNRKMTQSKIERLRKELIEKHGDRDLIYLVDERTGKRVFTLTISNIIIKNSADLKEVERIIKSGTTRTRRVALNAPAEAQKGAAV